VKVVFRVDAAIHIGIGHVMRCLTLANALQDRGIERQFICRELQGHMGEKISAEGHNLDLLAPPTQPIVQQSDLVQTPPHAAWLGENWEIDLEQTRAVLGADQFDWLVVDHYALDARWERGMRDLARQIMVIDDLADRPHDCDVVLDQTFGRRSEAYGMLVPANCECLTGAQYALLRPEFARLRPYSLKRRENAKLEHVFISLGGGDQHNVTGKVLEALKGCPLSKICRVTVVMGTEAPWLEVVQKQALEMPWPTEVKVNVLDMAQLMADSDLAIGAAGSTSWERCCLGLPTLMVAVAANQQHIAEVLAAEKAVLFLGEISRLASSLRAAFEEFNLSLVRLSALSQRARDIADGQGVETVMRYLESVDA
jgi:UDP-2,4-diacetamido-2,4,6-trideoxy-beta-L-altropyranose hydrolase